MSISCNQVFLINILNANIACLFYNYAKVAI